jgi:hypothetical protein
VFLLSACAGTQCPRCPQSPKQVRNEAPQKATAPEGHLTFVNEDKSQAYDALVAFFKSKGWGIYMDPAVAQLVLTSPQGTKFGMAINVLYGPGKLDRIEVFKAYRVKKEEQGNPKVVPLITRLNTAYSGFHFMMGKDNTFMCKSWIYFIDTLDTNALIQLMGWFDSYILNLVAKETPELVKMLQ